VVYRNGDGVARDDAMAIEWFRKAADGGDPKAQCSLGVMYVTGRGVTQDVDQATAWFNKAAAQGDEDAVEALRVIKAHTSKS